MAKNMNDDRTMDNKRVYMSTGHTIALGIYMCVLAIALLAVVLISWPSADTAWLNQKLGVEIRLLILCCALGAMGSTVHTMTSFAIYIGSHRLMASWFVWYLIRPFLGTIFGILVYIMIRGVLLLLISEDIPADAIDPLGVGSICGLAGMFSYQAIDKLKEILSNLFRTEPPGSET